MDEVTAFSIAAVALFGEGVTALGLVRSIMFHVDSQLFGPVGELALLAVGAVALFGEILAEGSLGFRAGMPEGGLDGRAIFRREIIFLLFGRSFALHVKRIAAASQIKIISGDLKHWQIYYLIIRPYL